MCGHITSKRALDNFDVSAVCVTKRQDFALCSRKMAQFSPLCDCILDNWCWHETTLFVRRCPQLVINSFKMGIKNEIISRVMLTDMTIMTRSCGNKAKDL